MASKAQEEYESLVLLVNNPSPDWKFLHKSFTKELLQERPPKTIWLACFRFFGLELELYNIA